MTARATAQGHAATIRDETGANLNTATRVGTNLRELADNCAFTEDVGVSIASFSDARLDVTANLPTNHLRGIATAFYATTAALAANTYANGILGVGATLTGNANGALAAIDGQTPAANDLVFVKNEVAAANNGVYLVTQPGDAGTPYILTRSVAADTAAKLAGCRVHVRLGTANANTNWCLNMTGSAITVGTTGLSFVSDSTSATVPAALGAAAAGTSPHLARRDHVHTMPSADQLATCAGDVALNNHKLTNVTDPSGAQDAATKNYVDSSARYFTGWGDVGVSAANADRFYNLWSSVTATSGTENISQFASPFACTATAIFHWQNVAMATNTVTDTLRINGVDSAVTCTLSAGASALTASGTGFSVAIAQLDILTIKNRENGTEAQGTARPRVAVRYKTSAAA